MIIHMNNTQIPFDNAQGQVPIQEQTIVQFPTSNAAQAKTQGNVPPMQKPQSSGTGFHKELEPMPSLQTHTEWMTPVENQVELEPEVEAAGVESVPVAPQITQEQKHLGLQLAKEAAKIEKSPGIQLKTTMTKPQAQQITKGWLLLKNTSNPLLWFAMLLYRQFQMAERKA